MLDWIGVEWSGVEWIVLCCVVCLFFSTPVDNKPLAVLVSLDILDYTVLHVLILIFLVGSLYK